MRTIISILIILSMFSCKLSKEQRVINRKSKKIERIAEKYNLKTIDTAKATIQYISNPVRIDTVMDYSLDTVYLDRDNLKIKYITRDKYIYLDAICDTIRDTIDVAVPYEVLQPVEYVKVPIPLSRWQKFTQGLGKGMFWIFIVAIILLILRQVIKTYNPFSWLK